MTEPTRYERIKSIALKCLDDEGIEYPQPLEKLEDIRLLGSRAVCDSMGLVSYLVALEEQVNSAMDSQIALMSERAMSMERSPFRNLEALVQYILELLEE